MPEWIAVDAEGGVVDVYRLLDLDTGESDAESIQFALDRAREGLSADPADPRRTLLERAEEILTEPRRKAAYDALLAQATGRSVGATRVVDRGPRFPRPGDLAPDQRWKLAVTAISLVATGILLWRQVGATPASFPKHRGAVPTATPADLVTSRLAPPPPKPTVVGLTLGAAWSVPGLQDLSGASSPALSADLRVLVFAKDNGPSGKDLWIFTRGDPGRPFPPPERLEACDTPAAEHDPTLSRDALELVFLRDGRPHTATRSSTGGPFRPAQPIELPGVDFNAEEIDNLRLNHDGKSLTFRVRKKGDGIKDPWSYRIAERPAMAAPFEASRPMPVWSPWASNVLSADGLRCYQASGEGLAISSRLGLDRTFALPGLLQRLTPNRVGTIDGPFWVAPKEDLVVYASTGPDPGRPGRLWMVQFR